MNELTPFSAVVANLQIYLYYNAIHITAQFIIIYKYNNTSNRFLALIGCVHYKQ